LGVQVEPAPIHVAEHWASVSTPHEPSVPQHAPVGCGQVLGSHTPPMVHTRLFVQSACWLTTHEPSAPQHEPSGCGHGLGSHAPPGMNTPLHDA
jgi:hypothetical protein